jgi:FkbM family methyltransferase
MTDQQWLDFKERARADGKLIENVIMDVYSNLLPEDACAIDGGANVGLHTLGLARRLGTGRVIAVEANPKTFATLEQRTKSFPQVTRIHAALQDDPERGQISFNCSSTHPGRSGVSRLWDRIAPDQVRYDEPLTVTATTIDRIVQEYGLARLDFIKLDLEGGEYHAVRGARHSLATLRPLVVSEHSIHAPAINGFEIATYLGWLDSLGYVPLAPNGAAATPDEPYPFWYVFLVPKERLPEFRPLLQGALQSHL